MKKRAFLHTSPAIIMIEAMGGAFSPMNVTEMPPNEGF
jgi:hypothetical protein